MTLLVLGLAIFLGIHSVSIVARPWRDAQLAQRGEGAWKGIYTVVSLVGFALLVYGYGQARQSPVVLWNPPAMTRHIAALLMVPVFPLLFASHLPGRIKTAVKHPMLLATKFWALAHLISNGNLADLLLFGAFLAWAVADRISVKRRPAPATAIGTPRPANDLIAIVGGLVVYVLFARWGHLWLIGVPPLG